MRDHNSTYSPYTFLTDSDSESFFAELDYRLRSGEHIQSQYRGQEDIFSFLSKYTTELAHYYKALFGLSLEEAGSAYGSRYYYLDSIEGVKNKVSNELRRPLKKEFVLLGIFLCKLQIDLSEVDTVRGFKRVLREDYEAYKDSFFRLLARVSGDDHIETDEEAVDKIIDSAFREFHRLGWVDLEGDRFEIMPSLERLRTLYVNEINNIDELLSYE